MVRYQKATVEVVTYDAVDGEFTSEGFRVAYRYEGLAEDKEDLELNEGDEFLEADTGKLYICLGGELVTAS